MSKIVFFKEKNNYPFHKK